jgi:hypothetical protein
MAEPYPFNTGRTVSQQAVVDITPGTVHASVTHAKNRSWVLTTATAGGAAFLPINHYRHLVTVDNTGCDQIAVIYFGSDDSDRTADGDHELRVPAGAFWEMPRPPYKGAMAVQLMGISGTGACLVFETSYE